MEMHRVSRQARIRSVEACWVTGRAADWHGLRRWAHMLGFGGHFLTKSRYYSVTFRVLREARAVWQRTQTSGPDPTRPKRPPCSSSTSSTSSAPAGTTPATPYSPTQPPPAPATSDRPPATHSPTKRQA
jgi:hypothetical protein